MSTGTSSREQSSDHERRLNVTFRYYIHHISPKQRFSFHDFSFFFFFPPGHREHIESRKPINYMSKSFSVSLNMETNQVLTNLQLCIPEYKVNNRLLVDKSRTV